MSWWYEIPSADRNEYGSKLIFKYNFFDSNESLLENFSTIIENYNYNKNFFVTKDIFMHGNKR